MRLARLGFTTAFGLLPLLSFGCSDPVPATPRGAFSVSFVDPGADCSIQGHNAAFGDVDDQSHGKVLVDGEGSASVDCRVAGSGSFEVSAQATDSSTGFGLSLAISGLSKGATEASPATGSASFSSPTTGGEPAVSDSANPCIFYFVEGSGQGVDAGKVWISFQCPAMRLDSSTACAIQQGYAIFENCES